MSDEPEVAEVLDGILDVETDAVKVVDMLAACHLHVCPVGHAVVDSPDGPQVVKLADFLGTTLHEDFLAGAQREAEYQRTKWDDGNKTESDWFWTLGYIAGKVLHRDEQPEKHLHHLTAAAGLLSNWYASIREKMAGPCDGEWTDAKGDRAVCFRQYGHEGKCGYPTPDELVPVSPDQEKG